MTPAKLSSRPSSTDYWRRAQTPYFPDRRAAESIPDEVTDFVERVLSLRDEEQLVDELVVDDDMREWANEINESTLRRYGEASRRAIAYAYGLPIDRLRRQPISYAKHESYVSVQSLTPQWKVRVPMDTEVDYVFSCPDPDDWIRTVFSRENIQRVSSYPATRWLEEKDSDLSPRQRIQELCERILFYIGDTTLFRNWPLKCLHLPSERGGIMHSYRAITSAALRKVAVAGIEPIEIEPLDGTSRDFLSFVISPESERRLGPSAEVFVDLASEVEERLRTEINVVKGPSGIDQIVATTPEGEFPAQSVIVNDIGARRTIARTLKHRLGVRDSLTIDEPEAHLHPEMQIEVANLLVRLASAGLTITFTTHSDYFLEQVNNAIRSTALIAQGSGSGDVPQGSRIGYDQVRALLFVRGEDGCRAIDAMDGIVYPIGEDTFTAASRRQYEESVPLINQLLERSTTVGKSD